MRPVRTSPRMRKRTIMAMTPASLPLTITPAMITQLMITQLTITRLTITQLMPAAATITRRQSPRRWTLPQPLPRWPRRLWGL